MYPFGPVMHGAGLNITLWSVNGKLHIGLISCPELLPDLSGPGRGFRCGLERAAIRDRLSHNSFQVFYSVTHPYRDGIAAKSSWISRT